VEQAKSEQNGKDPDRAGSQQSNSGTKASQHQGGMKAIEGKTFQAIKMEEIKQHHLNP
jgi:hypothetical protein